MIHLNALHRQQRFLMQLTCASYNIHRCIGADGRHDPERIRRVLHELDAPIIALQEVESPHDAPNLLAYLCAGSDWRAISGNTMLRGAGDYGNALLTRLPVASSEQIDLSVPGHEPRGAIHARFEFAGHRMQFIATHLGLWPGERRTQVLQLLNVLQAEVETASPAVAVLMGDLNEWFLWGRPLRWLHAHFQRPPAVATFPAQWPILSLDRIWVEPRQRLIAVQAWKSELARVASDHLPLIARIAFP